MAFFSTLSLENFRNIRQTGLEFDPYCNFLIGNNGSGKTNLLEALFFLALGKSQRNASVKDFVLQESEYFLAEVRIDSEGKPALRRTQGNRNGHLFQQDGHTFRSASDFIGDLPIISFAPEDILLCSGPPAERRRFLNMLLSQADINYFLSLKEYHRTLLQRNAYLKTERPDSHYLSVLTETLVRQGALLRTRRKEMLPTLQTCAQTHLSAMVADEQITLDISGPATDSEDEARIALETEFRRNERQEQLLCVTLAGPHRDDMLVRLNGLSVRDFASRGQTRSLALSLKLAAADVLSNRKGKNVVMLLDDIFSELDDARAERLLERIYGRGQIFAAAPRNLTSPNRRSTARFRVSNGTVTREA